MLFYSGFCIYHKSPSLTWGRSGDAMVLGKFQFRGVLLIWIILGQGSTALVVNAGGIVWIFSLIYLFSVLSPSLWETA